VSLAGRSVVVRHRTASRMDEKYGAYHNFRDDQECVRCVQESTQSQAAVDMLGHRLIHVKRVDLKRIDVVDEKTVNRIAHQPSVEYDMREAD
jgi:hypothetical protein